MRQSRARQSGAGALGGALRDPHPQQHRGPSSDSKSRLKHESASALEAEESLQQVYKVVPEVYFSRDFRLEDHDVFKRSIAQSFSTQEETSALMQHYLGVVEEGLFNQVRQAHSLRLFETVLESLGSVLAASGAVKKFLSEELAPKFRNVRESLAVATRVGKLGRRRERILDLRRRIDLILSIQKTLPTVQMLISADDHLTALDLLDSTRSALQDKLAGVSCVRSLREGLDTMSLRVSVGL